MNLSKKNDSRFWAIWVKSGAVARGDAAVAVPHILQSILRPSNLKLEYFQHEAEQLIRDGLAADSLEVEVAFGCSGGWFASFVHRGQQYVALGECDACPYCCQYEEESDGPSIKHPVSTLRRWLDNAEVRSVTSIETAVDDILAGTNQGLIHILGAIESQMEHRAQSA